MAAMNGIELAWMAMVAAGLTLALLHLLVWLRQRERLDFLVFSVLAASAAGFGAFELQMMPAATPQASAAAVRAAHVPLALFVVAAAIFVRLHFGPGRTGLLAASFELSGDVLRAASLSRELAASAQRLRAVVDATPSAILRVDAPGPIVLAGRLNTQIAGELGASEKTSSSTAAT